MFIQTKYFQNNSFCQSALKTPKNMPIQRKCKKNKNIFSRKVKIFGSSELSSVLLENLLSLKKIPVVISLIHLTMMVMTTIIIMTINHGEHDHEHLELTLNFDVGLGLYDSKLGSGDASVGVRLPDVGQQ